MENIINEYSLKSSVRNILYHHPQFIDCSASVSHEDVIAVLWTWSYHYYRKGTLTPVTDIIRLIERLRQKFPKLCIEDLGNVDGFDVRRIKLPNTTWYLKDMNHGYIISLRSDNKNISSEFSFRTPEENVEYMLTFDSYIPKVHDWIDSFQKEKTKEHMICNMIAVSARGIIEQVKEEESLDIPPVTHVHGTLTRKVYVEFEGMDKDLSCPLDYLRIRLIRRFRKNINRKR